MSLQQPFKKGDYITNLIYPPTAMTIKVFRVEQVNAASVDLSCCGNPNWFKSRLPIYDAPTLYRVGYRVLTLESLVKARLSGKVDSVIYKELLKEI